MREERKRSMWPLVAGDALGMLTFYVWAYYATVDPIQFGFGSEAEMEPLYLLPEWAPGPNVEWTHRSNHFCTPIFAPMYWMDQHVRPKVWEPSHKPHPAPAGSRPSA